MSRSPAQVMTALLRNSVPLSKSKPVMVKGISCTPTCKAARTWACALLRIVRVKTHPVCTQVTVDRRGRHREQFLPHRHAVPADAVDQLAVPFQAVQLHAHRRREVLAALPARGGPNPLQDLQCVIGELGRPLLAWPRRDRASSPRRALRRAGQPTPGVVPGPAGHGHHLVQYPALRPLVRGPERPGVPRGDLGTRRHRQPTLHALPRSPLRGHSYVRHGERFAGSFRESRRALDAHQLPEYPGPAHAVSPPSFRSLSKTKTTGRRGMSPQPARSGTHNNVTSALRASSRASHCSGEVVAYS